MFNIIDMDGWNVGAMDAFAETFLEFETFELAQKVVEHWNNWVEEE